MPLASLEIDQRGPGAAVPHPRYEFPEGCARCGGQEVAAAAKIMEMHAGEARCPKDETGEGRPTPSTQVHAVP